MTALPPELFAPDVAAAVAAMPRVDLLVGVPTYRNAGTVGHVVRAVETGLRKHFPDRSALIVVSDGHSDDGTVGAALAATVDDDQAARYLVRPGAVRPRRLAWSYVGPSGKGSAFRSIFAVAAALEPAACAVFDADLRSISPEWVDRLLGPVLAGEDFVTPLYARHKFDGTITNSIAYPLTAALYGRRVRQPIGGDFGFSARLAATWAGKRVWESDVARFGVDIWMTTVALCEGFRVCQANLGAKVHDPKDPAADLGPMFRQVVGSLFALAAKHPKQWLDVEAIEPVPTYGFPSAVAPEDVPVSRSRLVWRFVHGYALHHEMWARTLAPETLDGVRAAVDRAGRPGSDDLVIDARLWARVVFDYLIAYNEQVLPTAALLDSLVPLYLGRTATFVGEHADSPYETAEQAVSAYADLFLADKDYLRARWFTTGRRRALVEQAVPHEGAVAPDGELREPV